MYAAIFLSLNKYTTNVRPINEAEKILQIFSYPLIHAISNFIFIDIFHAQLHCWTFVIGNQICVYLILTTTLQLLAERTCMGYIDSFTTHTENLMSLRSTQNQTSHTWINLHTGLELKALFGTDGNVLHVRPTSNMHCYYFGIQISKELLAECVTLLIPRSNFWYLFKLWEQIYIIHIQLSGDAKCQITGF